MMRHSRLLITGAWAVQYLGFQAMGWPSRAAELPASTPTREERLVTTNWALGFHRAGSVARCQAMLQGWSRGRAYEKLAVAEALLESMATEEDCPPTSDYEWKPGTDDLSLPAGRAKWALERLLGVKLSRTVDRDASLKDLKALRAGASRLVEAYRQGIVALAADHEVPPEHFERLRRKYRGHIVPRTVQDVQKCFWAMDDLLGEWPPIGRKYEDLAVIAGAKARQRDYGVAYEFVSDRTATEVRLTIRNGVILSVHIRELE